VKLNPWKFLITSIQLAHAQLASWPNLQGSAPPTFHVHMCSACSIRSMLENVKTVNEQEKTVNAE